MSHATDRKLRRQKRKRWQQRGGGGMQQAGGGRLRTGALGKTSPFWQVVLGITTIGLVVLALVLILLGIFAT